MSEILPADIAWMLLLLSQALSKGIPRSFANTRTITLPRFEPEAKNE